MADGGITWITKGGQHIPIIDGKVGGKSTNDYMNGKIRNKGKSTTKNAKEYSLDIKNSRYNYIPPTQKNILMSPLIMR